MGPIHFKLSMSDGLTRRISFPARPSWSELATRIHAFCNIPFNRLALSYVDSDGDEVTLSSEAELRDFYGSHAESLLHGNHPIRFSVLELGSHRDADIFQDPTSPQQSSTRNTFGRPAPFVFVDDHHPFGDMFISSPLNSPHAFVEVVDEDVEKEDGFATDSDSDKPRPRDLRASVSEDVSSSPSVLADETPKKPPIHVNVHGLRPMDSSTFGPPHAASTPARERGTPTPSRPVPLRESQEESQPHLPGSFPDPRPPSWMPPLTPTFPSPMTSPLFWIHSIRCSSNIPKSGITCVPYSGMWVTGCTGMHNVTLWLVWRRTSNVWRVTRSLQPLQGSRDDARCSPAGPAASSKTSHRGRRKYSPCFWCWWHRALAI
ncbi:hypothetical protein BC826DRAFT_250662 [Russula brevipes]|nr:hypothetical protein BC826DRAFT_250662 [Russula brevipes]